LTAFKHNAQQQPTR